MPKKKSAVPQIIKFYASVADTQNAISFRGNGDGGRLLLEVPRSESGALLLLQQYGTEKLLEITLAIVDKDSPRPADPSSVESADTPADWSQIMQRSLENDLESNEL